MRYLILALAVLFVSAPGVRADEALAEVNAKRAARGRPALIYDPGLTVAAQGAANFRAANLTFGHTSNDFVFLPAGTPLVTGWNGTAAGCAAYPASYGFMACCVYDSYKYGGAWSAPGPDGKMYHHLFVSNTPSAVVLIAQKTDPKTVPNPMPTAPGAPAPTVVIPLQAAPCATAVASACGSTSTRTTIRSRVRVFERHRLFGFRAAGCG